MAPQAHELLRIIWTAAGWAPGLVLIITGLKLALKPRLQGWLGERAVASAVEGVAEDSLHDVVMPDARGGLTQIDHLLLTGEGIVVVETKSPSGRLSGPAEFPKGRPEGAVARRDLGVRLRAAQHRVPASWNRPWQQLKSYGATDSQARKAHTRQLRSRFGPDWRVALGYGLLAIGFAVLAF